VSGAVRRGHGQAGLALVIMLGAQLMIILDATVVNIALPHIQTGLHFSPTSLSWVLNGYTLTFGGLLLLGGRAGDILGRRRVFLAGIAIFTVASLVGGLAPSAGVLLAARAVQGAGGALASPAVLALVVSGFPEGRERTRALAIYAGVVTGGGSLGLVLGGVITQWLDWRWVLFINVPIGIAVLAATPLFVAETPRLPGRFDLTGAVTSTLGVAALVYAFIRIAGDGWGDRLGLASFAVAAVLLAVFLFNETRAPQPITPLRLFADASRSGSFAARLLLVGGMFGMFFFLTQFLQDVLGFSPLRAGVAFLPMTVLLFAVSRLTPRLMPVVGSKRLMLIGMLPVVVGMAWLSRVSPATSYWTGVFPPMVLLGAGMGVVFVPLTTASLAGVRPEESGAASSMVNVMQQLGGSLGLAVLVAVYGTARRSALAHPVAGLSASEFGRHVLAHGMGEAFALAAVFDAAALLLLAVLTRGQGMGVLPRRRPAPALDEPELVPVPDLPESLD
jgi:EmrB/QacA subfamily drug resistance transporter